jgi:hypothetical protein
MDAFDRLVTVNRHNPPPPLELCLPLELAIDRQWCENTVRAFMGTRKWEVFEATDSLADQLPNKSGIYMFVWRVPFRFPTQKLKDHHFRFIVYIGQAGGNGSGNSLQSRYKGEYGGIVGKSPISVWDAVADSRESRLSRYLNLRDLEFWYHEIGETDLLSAFEETLIKLFNPPANFQFAQRGAATLKGKLGRAIPAF